MNIESKKSKEVPARMTMQYTIERSKETLKWLKEIQEEFRNKCAREKDCSLLQKRKRILSDAFAMYVSTLVEEGGSGHSLIKSFEPHDFSNKFASLPIVKKCVLNRNNRSGHESRNYGNFVFPDEILESDLESWLSEAEYFVFTTPVRSKK